jgi:hypothetical protein
VKENRSCTVQLPLRDTSSFLPCLFSLYPHSTRDDVYGLYTYILVSGCVSHVCIYTHVQSSRHSRPRQGPGRQGMPGRYMCVEDPGGSDNNANSGIAATRKRQPPMSLEPPIHVCNNPTFSFILPPATPEDRYLNSTLSLFISI